MFQSSLGNHTVLSQSDSESCASADSVDCASSDFGFAGIDSSVDHLEQALNSNFEVSAGDTVLSQKQREVLRDIASHPTEWVSKVRASLSAWNSTKKELDHVLLEFRSRLSVEHQATLGKLILSFYKGWL